MLSVVFLSTVSSSRDKTPNSRSYCYDSEPHFQYWNDYTKRKEFIEAGDITETMSLQGSFFMMTRKKYWELNASDEAFGSWGSQGLQVANSTWLSGGKCVCNAKTWYAHLFRTQGGDFSFPYPQKHSEVLKARAHAKDFFFDNKFKRQIYPLSWLLERFWPIKGWSEDDYIRQKQRELLTKRSGIYSIENLVTGEIYPFKALNIHESALAAETALNKGECSDVKLQDDWNTYGASNFRWHVERFCRAHRLEKTFEEYKNKKLSHPKIMWSPPLTKGILYYTDGELDEKIAKPVRDNLLKAGLPITAVSLKPLEFGDKRIHFEGKRGVLTMAKQILAGLEAMDTDLVYMAEHDCLYPPSAFTYVPSSKDVYAYNINVFKLNTEKGYGLKVDDCRQLSGLCAYRETLINHYKERVRRLELGHSATRMGYEPGTHNRPERIDDLKSETWSSSEPLIDIRHKLNLTRSKWSKEEFRNKRYTEGWLESRVLPHWGAAPILAESLK